MMRKEKTIYCTLLSALYALPVLRSLMGVGAQIFGSSPKSTVPVGGILLCAGLLLMSFALWKGKRKLLSLGAMACILSAFAGFFTNFDYMAPHDACSMLIALAHVCILSMAGADQKLAKYYSGTAFIFVLTGAVCKAVLFPIRRFGILYAVEAILVYGIPAVLTGMILETEEDTVVSLPAALGNILRRLLDALVHGVPRMLAGIARGPHPDQENDQP